VRNVTDRVSNPFGMRAPRAAAEEDPAVEAVYGYGDANADVHVIGDHPGLHGGAGLALGEETATGVPFTDCEAGRCLQRVLHAVGLLAEPDSDAPEPRNCFLSYLHMTPTPDGRRPTEAEYERMEPFFDAELRAIAAHVLVPVGERAIGHVLREHTARLGEVDPATVHAVEVRGRGFLVVPLQDPVGWTESEEEAAVTTLGNVLAGDYEQISDLGRFGPDSDPYFVR